MKQENMHTEQHISVAQWLRMGIMIICCSTAVPLSWGVEEADRSTWNFEVLGSQMAADAVQHAGEAARGTGPAVAAPTLRQEESGITGQEIESVHTLSVPSNVSGVSVPTIATRESQRAASETRITILSAAPSLEEAVSTRIAVSSVATSMPQQVAPHEIESVSLLGDPIQAQGELAIPNVAPAALPTIREIPTPKRVGFCPVGPKGTGKSVLVNMAAMLEAYLNEEELAALDGWYDAQYLDHSDRQNPFTIEAEAGVPPLPELLDRALMRFVTGDKLLIALRAYLWSSIHNELPEKDTDANNKIYMPALRLAKYWWGTQRGVLNPSQVNTLYADEMQPYPVWDLVVVNEPGWWLLNMEIETGEQKRLSLMGEVKKILQPNADLAQNENDAIAAARIRWNCSTHLLFQLPAKAIVATKAPDRWGEVHLNDICTDEVVKAIQYANANSSLPILLAVSYASEEAEVLPNVEQVARWMGRWGVRVDNRHIFFFEFGGMMDLHLKNLGLLNQFSQWLEPGLANGERSEVLEEITPRLPQLATTLRLRWAKNLAMIHKLLKRIHALNNQRGDQSRSEAREMYGATLEQRIGVADAVKLSPRVTFNKATRQLVGFNHLDTNQIHFLRLFERGRGDGEALSYGADLRHNAEGLERDELFDVETGLRNSYLWEPRETVREEVRDGMIVRTHGTLTTILHPGYWLFFNLDRKTRVENKQSRIRNFEEANVTAHNTLQALQAVHWTPWRETQVGWLVLNADLCAGEMENKQVHEEQREQILEARTRNVCEMLGRITGRYCSSEKLNASSFVIPREGYQCNVRETSVINDGNAEMQQTHWVHPRSVDQGAFASYLNRNNL